MDQVVIGWFPSSFYANLYGIIVLAALLSDEIVPRLMGGKGFSIKQSRDRGSFFLIYLSTLMGLAVGIYFRFHNIGVAPFWVQALALLLIIAGALIREWAIVLLGRFFSRTVNIEPGQRLVTGGPYHWVRHPAYTGMVIMHTGFILGLGTWLGALFVFIIMLLPTLYRIAVEEQAMLETFGEEYRAYMHRTWRLFPGW
jgi:protein-S-isoprenylcysteine O-methyltransferase Ste14